MVPEQVASPHLATGWKYKFLSPTPDLLNRKPWVWAPISLCFHKSSRRFWQKLKCEGYCCRENSLNPIYPDRLQPPSHHATLVFQRPQKTHTSNSWKHAASHSKGGKLASGTLTCRENTGEDFVIAFNRRPIPFCSCLQDTRALPKEGGASLINIITQASCLESPHMENCILQSVEAAKSPAESIDFYFNDVCDQYLNRIDRACR